MDEKTKKIKEESHEILNMGYKQELLLEKSKESENFKEMNKKSTTQKLLEVLEKYPKHKVVMNFK